MRAQGYVGQPMRRREDRALLRGEGRFIGDIEPPGTLHCAVVRSPYAHARLLELDTSDAMGCPGVMAVLTARDLGDANRPLPNRFPHAALRYYPQFPLAGTKVHYVGEPVAVVVAENRYLAEDAADLVRAEYDPLPAVVEMTRALDPGAPAIHDDQGAQENLAGRFVQAFGDIEAAFAAAHLVVRERLTIAKCGGIPMECRGILAVPDPFGKLTVYDSTQTPHMIRDIMAELLGKSQHDIRVIPPDVGGGFGVKEPFYPEEFLVPYLALRLGRPVKWLEDRRENLLASIQERGQVHHAEMAVDRNGRILGVRDRFVADSGAFCPWGIVVPLITATMLPGPYKLPAYRCEADVVYTNTCPLAPYRGAGRPQAVFVMERLLHEAAAALGIDQAEIRYRNLIQPEEFPYSVGLTARDGSPLQYDSGNYPACLDTLMGLIDYQGLPAAREEARARGCLLGLGLGLCVENTGLGPHEGARVRVDSNGRVVVYTGACSQGQGHQTTLAQLAADALGVDPERVAVVGGDTDGIPYGAGTFASRTAINAGSAVVAACAAVKEQALKVAAHLLEAAVEDLELAHGSVRVKGVPERHKSLAQVAAFAAAPFPGQTFPANLAIGLEATEYFTPRAATYSSMVQAAVVEVDPGTGTVQIRQFAGVHDCGNIINPLIVDGQVLGGFAAGIGNALYEEMVYSEEGQLLTGSFMDYLIPGAMEIPELKMAHVCSPSPLNPLGVKGVGETATIPVPAAVSNAVADALGVAVNYSPLSPGRVRDLVRSAGLQMVKRATAQ